MNSGTNNAIPSLDTDPAWEALCQQALRMEFLMFTYGGGRERLKKLLRDAKQIEIPVLLEDRTGTYDNMAGH